MSENLDLAIGMNITSNKDVVMTVKRKVTGKIYKFKEEFGHTYAYVKDDEDRLFRFDVNDITII